MNGYEELQESIVRIAADIGGPHSAAALALKNADERRAAGQEVKFFRGKGSILVQGKAKAAAPTAEGEPK